MLSNGLGLHLGGAKFRKLLFDYTLFDMFNPISFIKVEQAGHISQIFKVTANPISNTFNLTPYTDPAYDISEFTGDLLITALVPDGTMLSGNVNLDGGFNILDAVTMVSYLIGNLEFNQQQLVNADMNNDGTINILDIVQLVNIILD